MSMSRLTKKDDSGNWSLKGLPWKDTYVGQVITRNTEEKIYGALCKLRDYEESGLDPEQVQQLKERDTAKRPEQTNGEYCDQWMRGEDSGDGTYYYPIEGSTQYFWVEYSF